MTTLLYVGCQSDHGGMIITGDPVMVIDGRPVARISDLHSCPQSYPDGQPHSVTPISPVYSCSNRPMIRGIFAAVAGDESACGATLLPCGGNANVDC